MSESQRALLRMIRRARQLVASAERYRMWGQLDVAQEEVIRAGAVMHAARIASVELFGHPTTASLYPRGR